ncbi:hypothetical protein PDJAM_G00236230, partial [Pangasius djambal]|nr:hypothetical protein [Pangasius djambal]
SLSLSLSLFFYISVVFQARRPVGILRIPSLTPVSAVLNICCGVFLNFKAEERKQCGIVACSNFQQIE